MHRVKPGHCVAVANDRLYCAGKVKTTGTDKTNFMKYYDAEQNKWIVCTPMNTTRSKFGFIHLNGYLYAVGGEHGEGDYNRALDSFERYSVSRGKWQKLPCLPHILEKTTYGFKTSITPSVAIHKHFILVAGYSSQQRCNQIGSIIDSKQYRVMVFDTVKNTWHTLNSTHFGTGRELHVHVANNTVYLITFHTTKSRLSKSNQWETCPRVYPCKYDVYSNPSKPTFSIEEHVSQKCVPESKMRVFRIGSEIYIILRGYVYKTSVTIAKGQVYDADLSPFLPLYSKIDNDNYAVTSFSLNRKFVK